MEKGTKYRIIAWTLTILIGVVCLHAQVLALNHQEARVESPIINTAPAKAMPKAPASNIDSRQVTECLIKAVVLVESGGDPTKVGLAGERGVMQIKRSTWAEVTEKVYGRVLSFDLAFNADMNRRVGKAYFAQLQEFLQKNRKGWRADERSLLLACYNAGPNRVMEAGFDLRNLSESTQSYVERAVALHDNFLSADAARVRAMLMVQKIATKATDQT